MSNRYLVAMDDVFVEMHTNMRQYPTEQHMDDGIVGPDDPKLAQKLREVRMYNDLTDTPGHGPLFLEEALEVMTAGSPENLRDELVQVCAVAMRWIVDIDSRKERGDE